MKIQIKNFGTIKWGAVNITIDTQPEIGNYGTDSDVRYYASGSDAHGNEYAIEWEYLLTDHIMGEDGHCILDTCGGYCEDESNACDWDNPIKCEVQ